MCNMKRFLAYLLVLVACSSCGLLKPRTVIEYRDSVRVEYRYRERLVHDTVTVHIGHFIDRIITRDTVSHLENDFALSDAVVTDGYLKHSLETKEQDIHVPVTVVVHDTLIVQDEHKEEIQTITVKEPVPLTAWQQFRFKGFWWCILIITVLLLYIFRKPLLLLAERRFPFFHR